MRHRQDLPLNSDIAARFLPLIVGVMVYLGTLCFVFALFIVHSASSWETQFNTDFTIEIPLSSQYPSSSIQARVLQLLSKTPGVQHAAALPQKDLVSLLQPLLGTTTPLDLESLPILIDVSLSGKEIVDVTNLEAHLKNISPEIELIDHRQWQNHVLTLIKASVLLAVILTFLILLAALVTTSFATRTSLLIHRHVIEILHLIGATHSYIARQFQLHTLKQGLIASTLGAFMAFLTFIGIGILLEKAGFSFALNSSFFLQAVCVFALAPFFTSFFMMLSAYRTVLKGLR